MQQLFAFIKVPNNYWHDWSDSNAWIMAKCMHKIAFTNTRMVVQKVRFISIFINEDAILMYKDFKFFYTLNGCE